ncbi:hypothetical protein OXX69_013189, partial [Metschnikowia pulcherrima]
QGRRLAHGGGAAHSPCPRQRGLSYSRRRTEISRLGADARETLASEPSHVDRRGETRGGEGRHGAGRYLPTPVTHRSFRHRARGSRVVRVVCGDHESGWYSGSASSAHDLFRRARGGLAR